jgi:hypothetical protein
VATGRLHTGQDNGAAMIGQIRPTAPLGKPTPAPTGG